jgi:GT2 family glycosyltransferase
MTESDIQRAGFCGGAPERMKISVLIATCDRSPLLRKCLASICGNSRPADEIVVADQSDGPETKSLVDGFDAGPVRVRYLRLDRRGKSRALNEAIRIANGDFLALTDDDVEVDERWLETIDALHAEHPRVVAFCGRVLPEPGSDPARYYNLVLSTRPRWITRRSNPLTPGFCGANIVVGRSALLDAGGYNVHFGPGGMFRNNDDGELAYRLTRRGAELLFAPELFVYHSSWRGETDTDSLKLEYTYSLGAFAGYYLRRGHLRPVLYLVKKGLFKSRQLLTGLVLRDRPKIRDARIQLRGLSRGLFTGMAIADDGTIPAATTSPAADA